MTNHPLTAASIAEKYGQALFNIGRANLASDIAAYAAQQNAELVAWVTDSEKKIMKKVEENDRLQAENERLKQAAALFREASFQGHSSHWDSQGTSGANCPACSKASNLRRQADDLLSQPPKEADSLVAVDAWEAT